jgi:hypothetical protein
MLRQVFSEFTAFVSLLDHHNVDNVEWNVPPTYLLISVLSHHWYKLPVPIQREHPELLLVIVNQLYVFRSS